MPDQVRHDGIFAFNCLVATMGCQAGIGRSDLQSKIFQTGCRYSGRKLAGEGEDCFTRRGDEFMEKKATTNRNKYIKVKDHEGNIYVCRRDALKNVNEVEDKEKSGCLGVPTHGIGA